MAYVGMAEFSRGLRKRFGEEWRRKHSGRSSPRRTIGVLLWDELNLVPRPRPTKTAKLNPKQFCFEEDGELRLTNWLDPRAEFAYRVITQEELGREQLADLEGRLIRHLKPPINRGKWDNPIGAELGRLRNDAVEDARRWIESQ